MYFEHDTYPCVLEAAKWDLSDLPNANFKLISASTTLHVPPLSTWTMWLLRIHPYKSELTVCDTMKTG